MNTAQQWYVVQTKPHNESVAIDNLERQGYTTYCPKIRQARRHRQRWCEIIEPLFPRYLFVRLDLEVDNISPIRSTIGVLDLVRFGAQPASIPEEVIETIQQQERDLATQYVSHQVCKPGDCIEVVKGPFAGMSGIFEKKDNQERVIILLEILGRESHVRLTADNLSPKCA